MDLIMTNSLPSGTILKGEAATYIIKRMLGQGGFGITYLAEIHSKNANSMHLQFAIKEFYAQDFCHRNGTQVEIIREEQKMNFLKERFRREAERISSFNHPNVVKTQEIFEANNTVYYVMQYLSGGSLENKKILSEETAIQYIRSIALVLKELHENKINHLDIKPDNIMLNEQGEPVLIDFGISRGYLEDGSSTSIHEVSALSPGYAPPEQYGNGAQTFSPQLDIYALGATLYRLVTGQRPPVSTELHNLDMQLLFPSSVSPQMQKLIKTAMQPSSWNRPESMEQYIRQIEAYSLSGNNGKTSIYPQDNGATKIEFPVQPPMPNQNPKYGPTPPLSQTPAAPQKQNINSKAVGAIAIAVALGLGGFFLMNRSEKEPDRTPQETVQSPVQENKPETTTGKTTSGSTSSERKAEQRTTRQTAQSKPTTQTQKTVAEESSSTANRETAKETTPTTVTPTATTASPTTTTRQTPPTSAPAELSADELLQKGMSAYKKFKYENAAQYFLQAADKGNLSAIYHLGDLYYNGNGVAKSYPTAKQLFTTAAERGNKDAQYMLGVMLRNGQGGEKNIQQAKIWLQKAANQGHSKAERLLDSL